MTSGALRRHVLEVIRSFLSGIVLEIAPFPWPWIASVANGPVARAILRPVRCSALTRLVVGAASRSHSGPMSAIKRSRFPVISRRRFYPRIPSPRHPADGRRGTIIGSGENNGKWSRRLFYASALVPPMARDGNGARLYRGRVRLAGCEGD